MDDTEIVSTVVQLLGYLLFLISELLGLSTCKSNAVVELLIKRCLGPAPDRDIETQTE